MMREGTDKDEAEELFREIDTSQSNNLSLAEIDLYFLNQTMDAVSMRFKKIDADGDKQISKKEWFSYFQSQGMKRSKIKKLWEKVDTSGNGKVNFAEFDTYANMEIAR